MPTTFPTLIGFYCLHINSYHAKPYNTPKKQIALLIILNSNDNYSSEMLPYPSYPMPPQTPAIPKLLTKTPLNPHVQNQAT